MKESTAREVGDMMASVVREGTGTAAALAGIDVAGKTGTAEIIPAQNINQPWFIGFAPRDNPQRRRRGDDRAVDREPEEW